MAWTSPKLDWITNPVNPTPTDLNRIEGNIDFLKTDIETKKGDIVDALNAVGISASLSDTHAELATKIETAEKTGITITPSTVNQVIPNGIYDTGGGVVLGDADLVADNIKSGANIFGVVGSFGNSVEGYQAYTTVGSTSFTVPSGVTSVFIMVIGGGGGGGSTLASNTSGTGGGGGAGGVYMGKVSVTPGSSIPIVVGGGGSAPYKTSSGVAGSGGNSSFGSYIGYGGSGGVCGDGGAGGAGGAGGGEMGWTGASGATGRNFTGDTCNASLGQAPVTGGGAYGQGGWGDRIQGGVGVKGAVFIKW
jgi:hypothetical protein